MQTLFQAANALLQRWRPACQYSSHLQLLQEALPSDVELCVQA